MKTYFAYIRVSTQKQGQTGVSLQEQRSAIERYASQNNLNISEWFEERETAAKRGRPIFSDMINRLRIAKADGVIIHKIDRSARNLKDWADLGELIDSGIDVFFTTESLDLSSRGGRLAADLQAVVAADFIRNLREETKKGMYGRLKQGLYPLRAPVGYLDQGRGKVKIPDPKRAPLIRHAFERYASATCSLDGLLSELRDLGLRNVCGRPISRNGLSTVLNNPFYTGIIRLKTTGETFKGAHEPLISISQFERVQAVLTGKTNTRIVKHDFLFRRILKCYHCNYSLIGERQKGHVYYRCHTKTCPTKGIRERQVNGDIVDIFDSVTLTQVELKELYHQLDTFDRNWATKKNDLIATVRLSLTKMQERSDRLTDALIDGLISKEVYEERRAKLLVSIRKLEEQIERIQANGRSIPEHVAKFLELIETAKNGYISGNTFEKRQLLNSITSNRYIQGKNVAVELREPFAMMAKRQKSTRCDHSQTSPRTLHQNYITKLAQELWTQAGG